MTLADLLEQAYIVFSLPSLSRNKRTEIRKDQFEVDYIEDDGGRLNAWEFKWRADSPRGITRAFTNAYPDAALATVTTTNYIDFVG